jgi:hypothetical protein
MILLYKLLGFAVGATVLVPVTILVCLPYLLAVSTADREEYWASFWWRTKRIAAAAATVGGIIGICLVRWH